MSRFKVKDNNDQWVDISANGVGVPSGGTQGQVLAKRSGTSYDAGWVNPSGGVHVGPTAPTDAFTTIWLDTDEQGASSVSSVNGKNGTVVLDADDVGAMSEWELLWTNASVNSSFSAQKISVDLSSYNIVMIEFFTMITAVATSGAYTSAFALIDGLTHIVEERNGTAGSAYGRGGRGFTPDQTGVTFLDATTQTAWAASGTDNRMMVPYRILGIKGVQLS